MSFSYLNGWSVGDSVCLLRKMPDGSKKETKRSYMPYFYIKTEDYKRLSERRWTELKEKGWIHRMVLDENFKEFIRIYVKRAFKPRSPEVEFGLFFQGTFKYRDLLEYL